MERLALLLCLLLSSAAPAWAAASSREDVARQQVEAVVESFRTAIIDRDKERFSQLFLHEQATWQSVMSDEGLALVRRKNPQAAKVRVMPDRNYRSFIEGIVANKARSEETFDNIRIDTDGDIASVYFDYSFNADGRRTNYGQEAWHLVNTDAGWKIVSVIWSVTPVPPEDKPRTGS